MSDDAPDTTSAAPDDTAGGTRLDTLAVAETTIFPEGGDEVVETVFAPLEENSGYLGTCAPFAPLRRRVRQVLEAEMTTRHFAPGAYLLRQGDPGRSLLIICDGMAEIAMDDGAGRHFIERVGPGEVLGEMSLLTDEPCTAHAVATTPVRALALSAEKFHTLATAHPEISHALTLLVSSRLGARGRDVLAGKTLGGYRIVQRLGRGGMAVVYEAEELTGGRRVALKMMSHRLVYDRAAREQFQREADIIESFDHPNIARNLGRFAAFHTYFIAMEYCDGRTLHRIIREGGPMRESEARKVVGQLAAALDYAHRAGIVHRDVKPANVMVNRNGTVILTDFGLARPVLDGDESPEGLIVGTPRYMAPEQLAGGPLGPAVDYFALGCTFFEMLAGRPLLVEKEVPLLSKLFRDWTVPDFQTLLPEASRESRQLLQRCLAAAPHERRIELDALVQWAGPVCADGA